MKYDLDLDDFNFIFITIIVDVVAANTIIIGVMIVIDGGNGVGTTVIVCGVELKTTMSLVCAIFLNLIQKTLEILHFARFLTVSSIHSISFVLF